MKTTGTNPEIEILFEDNHLLAISKPAGVLSQEDRTGNPDVLTLCKEYLKREYNKPGNVFLGLLHRLDKPVSGVMLLAKTSKAASRISEQIRNQKVKKTYLTLVEGNAPENGFLTHFLIKNKSTNTTTVTAKNTPGAKESKLTFEKIGFTSNRSLLKVNLITGRAHQIRVQLAHYGFPVTGDKKYGRSSKEGICLHAFEIEIVHPTLNEVVRFGSKPPKSFDWEPFQSFLKE